MSDSNEIVCKPSNWVKIRGVLILLMLGVFSFLFFKDGTKGYKEKNLHYFVHHLMTEKAPQVAVNKEKNFNEVSWKAFANEQTIPFPESSEGPVPEEAEDMKWPEILGENFDAVKEGNADAANLWKEYSKEKRWDEKPVEQPYDQSQINTQFYFAYGCAVLFLVVLFFFLRILSRQMIVSEAGYTPPGGKEIAFSQMNKIDKRKWDVKGVATIYYNDGSETKKVKVDGMIYGQFKKADGEPAEKLFSRILDRFKGEIIEYEEVEEDEESAQAAV